MIHRNRRNINTFNSLQMTYLFSFKSKPNDISYHKWHRSYRRYERLCPFVSVFPPLYISTTSSTSRRAHRCVVITTKPRKIVLVPLFLAAVPDATMFSAAEVRQGPIDKIFVFFVIYAVAIPQRSKRIHGGVATLNQITVIPQDDDFFPPLLLLLLHHPNRSSCTLAKTPASVSGPSTLLHPVNALIRFASRNMADGPPRGGLASGRSWEGESGGQREICYDLCSRAHCQRWSSGERGLRECVEDVYGDRVVRGNGPEMPQKSR